MFSKPIYFLFICLAMVVPSRAGDVYYVGNSLVNHYLPWVVQHLASAHPHQYKVSLINGAGLRYQWENHGNTNNGVDAWVELPTGQYQKLLLNESVPLTTAYTWNKPALHARRFAELALPARPDLQVYLYGTWPHIINAPNHPWTKPSWSEEVDGDRLIMETVANQLDAELSLNQPVVIIPASQALRSLRAEIAAGTVPGLTQFETLFTDDIHLSPLGHYFVGLVFYTSFFSADPRGLTGTIPGIWGGTYIDVAAPLRARLQEIVWSVVHQYGRSGIDAPQDDDGDGIPNDSDACPQSNTRAELGFNSCMSGVANLALGDGCTLADLYDMCAESQTTRAGFLACSAQLSDDLVAQGYLSAAEAQMVQTCASDYGLPNPIVDVYTLDNSQAFLVTAPGILGNDLDEQGDTLSAELEQPPSAGSLTLEPDGSFVFTPDSGMSGEFSFSYRCWDGESYRIANVILTVINQSDLDGDGVADSVDSCPNSDIQATVSINGCDSGVPNLRHSDGCTLSDRIAACAATNPPRWSFIYCVNQLTSAYVRNGELTQTQAQALASCAQQYDLPTAVADSYSIAQNTTLNVAAPGLLANDFDLEGDRMETHLHQGPSSGRLSLSRDGSFRYTPNNGQTGTVSFVYRCWDGSGYRTATVTIQIQ